MSENTINGLECAKVEKKETETDKGLGITYTYTFQNEDKETVITLKTTQEKDYTVGQDVNVIIDRPQTSVNDFEPEGDGQLDTLQEAEAEAKPEKPAKQPIIEDSLCENPGCKENATVELEDGEWVCAEHVKKETETEEPEPERPNCELCGKPADVKTDGKDQCAECANKEVPEEEQEPEETEEPEIVEPPIKEHEHVFENPSCKYYHKPDNKEDPGMCAKGTRTAPFCEGPDCEDLTETLEEIPDEQYEVDIDLTEPEMTEGSVVMELLINIDKDMTDDELIETVNKKFESFGKDEFSNIMDWLAEESYITLPNPDKNTQLTPRGKEIIAPTTVEEKGSPDTPSKENNTPETPPPSALFVNPTTVRGVSKIRWQCPSCGDRWNRAPDKTGTMTKCKGCGTELMLVTTEPTPEKITVPFEPQTAEDSLSKEQADKIIKPEQPPLQDTLDALTNGDDKLPELDPSATVPHEKFEEPEIEKDPEPDWGMTGDVLLKKTDFPTTNLGGLKTDITVEKNMKGKFLYAHALSFQVPVNGIQTQKFCEELKAKTGYDWTHVLDSTFNCDKDQLNKAPVSE